MTPPTPSSIHKARSIDVDAQSSSKQPSMEESELEFQMYNRNGGRGKSGCLLEVKKKRGPSVPDLGKQLGGTGQNKTRKVISCNSQPGTDMK